MRGLACVLLGNLLCAAAWGSFKVKEERRTAFFGEDVHVEVPAGRAGGVVFWAKGNRSDPVPLLQAGEALSPRARLNAFGHLVLADVREEDEGVYVVTADGDVLARLALDVRDCAVEEVVKYGDTYYIHLKEVQGPISLEFRPGPGPVRSDLELATEPPAALLLRRSLVVADAYAGRLSVSERSVALRSVKMADEGSFTVRDREGKIRRRNCLHVRAHQDFLHPYKGADMTVKLYLHHAEVNVVYRPKSSHRDGPVLERGVPATPPDAQLAGRVSAEGSELLVRQVRESDGGVFKVTDLAGFPVAHVYVDVVASDPAPLTVAVLSLLSLLAAMLLVCLLSCLREERRRNRKNEKPPAGQGEGEAFRQVVQEAYDRFTEESLTRSACRKPSEDADVVIEAPEASKAGSYRMLTSDADLPEMSDSGVDCALPPDGDADIAAARPSREPPSPDPEGREAKEDPGVHAPSRLSARDEAEPKEDATQSA
ncbi:uncharacterized protein LOC133502717 [Syngnathoides biaculeatus]|uniref:uncharacterized protein LOC133502717 n=1 Tax=Syngnathoides biaculeatus TaxID=300417 RepID=UPI002ADD3BCD|nr:uncharacterized protein LOC133502717 [Syngnathoides biaculeatus]